MSDGKFTFSDAMIHTLSEINRLETANDLLARKLAAAMEGLELIAKGGAYAWEYACAAIKQVEGMK